MDSCEKFSYGQKQTVNIVKTIAKRVGENDKNKGRITIYKSKNADKFAINPNLI